ncbi:MAG: hypothetical protein ACRECX_01405 [Methyloceanibacter sp.]
MRKLAVAFGLAAAVMLAGGIAWKAEATNWKSATVNLPTVAKTYSPVEKAGCFRRGRCGWGRYRVCGPLRCWCAPC